MDCKFPGDGCALSDRDYFNSYMIESTRTTTGKKKKKLGNSIVKLVCKYIKGTESDVMIDVGSATGLRSFGPYLEYFNQAIAVEPNPMFRNYLTEAFRAKEGVVILGERVQDLLEKNLLPQADLILLSSTLYHIDQKR